MPATRPLRQVLLGAPRTHREAVTPSPVFAVVVLVTVVGGVLAWFDTSTRLTGIGVFLFVIGGWVFSLCLHEFAHALAAYRAGDRDVLSAGYLTLNPFLYGNWVFSVLLPVVFVIAGGIGLPGGAVYLHKHRFRSRAQATWVSLAGPAVNLVLGGLLLVLVRLRGEGLGFSSGSFYYLGAHDGLWAGVAFLGFLQISAALLSLLPIPGLDGWGAIEPWVKPSTAQTAARLSPFGMIAVFLIFWIPTVNSAFFSLVEALYRVTGASDTLAGLGRLLFRFWSLSG